MGLFTFIVLFFLIAWKACPFCFHGIMKRVTPEFYEIKKKNQQVQVMKQKFTNQLSQYIKGVQFPGMVGLSTLLISILPEHIKMPNIKPNVPLQELLDELEGLFSRLPQLPMITVPELPQAVLPQVVLKTLIAEIPKYQLTIPVSLPPNPIPDDLFHILSLRLPNVSVFQLNMISLRDVIDFLRTRVDVPEIDLLRDLLATIPTPLVPSMILPKVVFH